MNQLQVKKSPRIIKITLICAFTVISATLIALSYIFGSDPIRVSATIFVEIIPAIVSAWLLVSLCAYVVFKYMGKVPRAARINLKASSITVGALLLLMLFAMFISVIAFGIHPIEALTELLN